MKKLLVLFGLIFFSSLISAEFIIPANFSELSRTQVESITEFDRWETRETQVYAIFEDEVDFEEIEIDVLYSCVEDTVQNYREFGCFEGQQKQIRFALRHELPTCTATWVQEEKFVNNVVCEICPKIIPLSDWSFELDLGEGQFLESRDVIEFVGTQCQESQTKQVRLGSGISLPFSNLISGLSLLNIIAISIFGISGLLLIWNSFFRR